MCNERFINPFTDFGFKRLFGSDSNKEFLISFLNSLFDDPDKIVDISYRNVEQFGKSVDDRSAVFDLYCTTESDAHIIVEMQNAYQRYFMDRSIYYSSFPMQEVAKRGDWDFRLPKIYTVAFLNFRMNEFVDDTQFKHVVKLADVQTGRVFYDKLTYIYLEMPKFNKSIDELENDFDNWLYVIKNMDQLDEHPAALKEKVFKKFFKIAAIEAFSPEERLAYEASLKSMRDYNNTLKSAEWRGEQRGHAEGVTEATMAIARKMLADGVDAETIAQYTGLTPDQIK